jgi:hypothetical protein
MIVKLAEHMKFPGGRYKSDGDNSAEEFRDDVLLPALRLHRTIVVDLNMTYGISMSWLEECFGGLVRAGLSSHKLLERIEFMCNDSLLIAEVVDCIKRAQR